MSNSPSSYFNLDLDAIEKEGDKDKFETAKKEFELQYEKLKKLWKIVMTAKIKRKL